MNNAAATTVAPPRSKEALQLRSARVAVGALVASPALAIVEAPWSSRRTLLAASCCLLPAAALAAILAELLASLARRVPTALFRGEGRLGRVAWPSAAGITVLLAGIYLSNVLLVAEPLAGPTLLGYAVTLVASALVTRGFRTLLLRSWPPVARLLRTPHLVFGAAALASGTLLAIVDATSYPLFYRRAHLAVAAAALVCFAVTARTLASRTPRRAVVGGVLTTWTALVAMQGTMSLGEVAATVVRYPTIHRRAWLAFGNWTSGAEGRSPPCAPATFIEERGRQSEPESARPATSPTVTLLVTIDAFRCGFGRADRPELRTACPFLTGLLASTNFRLDAHASAPSTAVSTKSMQHLRGVPVATTLAAAGIHTAVIVTHPRILDSVDVRRSFHDVDESLVPIARSGVRTTSAETTAQIMARLRAMTTDGKRHYLWAHYFDAHAPYVKSPDSPWRISDLEAYVAEVERIDASLRELVESIRSEVHVPVALLLTADHGEEFGEHRGFAHGGDLYEEATRIPFIVWSNDAALAASLPSELPSGSAEIGAYIVSTALGLTFRSSEVARFAAASDDDDQYGVVARGWKLIDHRSLGYSELYDLRSDPLERRDLARARPEKVRELACLLTQP